MNKNGACCPKCSGTQGYIAHDYFSGWAQAMGEWGEIDSTPESMYGQRGYLGEEYSTFMDTVRCKTRSKTAICLDCGKRVERPK